MSQLNHCNQCGTRLNGDEVYCGNCGSKIAWEPAEFSQSESAEASQSPMADLQDILTEPPVELQEEAIESQPPQQPHKEIEPQPPSSIITPAGAPTTTLNPEPEQLWTEAPASNFGNSAPEQPQAQGPAQGQSRFPGDSASGQPGAQPPATNLTGSAPEQPQAQGTDQGQARFSGDSVAGQTGAQPPAPNYAGSAPTQPARNKPKWLYPLLGLAGALAIAVGVLLSGAGIGGGGNFAVQFDPNGGSGGPSTLEVQKNEAVAEPYAEPTLSDYKFTGWFTDSQGQYRYDFSKPVQEDLTLFAGWEEEDAPVTEAASQTPKTVGEYDQIDSQSPSYYVTAKSQSGIYVRKEPYVPKKVDENKILYIEQGDVTVQLTNLHQTYLDKYGYTWLKVGTPNGIGWVREDIVRGVY